MVETFHRRDYQDFIKSKTLIVIDEAHLTTFEKVFPLIDEKTIVIGATATPYRKGKNTPSLNEFYTDIVQSVDTKDLIELGYLSEAKTYGIPIDLKGVKKKGIDYDVADYYETNRTYEGVVSNWERLTKNTKTIIFSSNVKSSKRVTNEFVSKGYDAKHIDGKTPKNERKEILEWFDKTPNAILSNCGILNAGFDQPDIETVILYRATTSLPLFLQMCGRGSRVTDTKKEFTILDFGNNIKRLDFWESPRTWKLEKETTRTKKEDAKPIKECPKCYALIPTTAKSCKCCGYKFPIKKKEKPIIVNLELIKKSTNSELVRLCKAKKLNAFRVLHNKTDYNDALEFITLMGYKRGFIYQNKKRFKVFDK